MENNDNNNKNNDNNNNIDNANFELKKANLTKLQYYVTQENGTEKLLTMNIGIIKKKEFMLILYQEKFYFHLKINMILKLVGHHLQNLLIKIIL